MNKLNLDQTQQGQLTSWMNQQHPGYSIDFQNSTITGPRPLERTQLEQINSYVNKTFGVQSQLVFGTHGEQTAGV